MAKYRIYFHWGNNPKDIKMRTPVSTHKTKELAQKKMREVHAPNIKRLKKEDKWRVGIDKVKTKSKRRK